MQSDQHWDKARQIVRTWLKDQKLTSARLAQRAGLQRSLISRFLHGKPVSPSSAVRIFEVIQPTLNVEERLSLLEAFGLSRFSDLAIPTGFAPDDQSVLSTRPQVFQSQMDSITNGAEILTKAITLGATKPTQSAQLCFLAEQVFAQSASSALIAARIGMQFLVNLGSWEEADREITRIMTVYGPFSDPQMALSLMSARGWLEYDRGDLSACASIFERSLQLAEAHCLEADVDEAHHFLALCNLGFGRKVDNKAESIGFLCQAMAHLQQSMTLQQRRYMPEVVHGFAHYRKGQILDALGEYHDANRAFSHARILMPEAAFNHIDLHLCEHWLEDGDTTKACYVAHEALQHTAHQQYAGGLSRAARVLAQAHQQEGKTELALEYAVAAVGFDPYGWFGPQRETVMDLVKAIGGLTQRQLDKRSYQRLLHGLQDKTATRQGIFEYLNRIAADRSDAIGKVFACLSTTVR